jgi:hypothetical protein
MERDEAALQEAELRRWSRLPTTRYKPEGGPLYTIATLDQHNGVETAARSTACLAVRADMVQYTRLLFKATDVRSNQPHDMELHTISM